LDKPVIVTSGQAYFSPNVYPASPNYFHRWNNLLRFDAGINRPRRLSHQLYWTNGKGIDSKRLIIVNLNQVTRMKIFQLLKPFARENGHIFWLLQLIHMPRFSGHALKRQGINVCLSGGLSKSDRNVTATWILRF